MSTFDPQTVREIAREIISKQAQYWNAAEIRQGYRMDPRCARLGDEDFTDLRDAVINAIVAATVTVKWPDEQQPASSGHDAVEAAVEQLDAALRTVFGLRYPVLELGPQSVDALRTVLDALERLGRTEQQPAGPVSGEQQDGAAPRRVCLCGSTRFRSEFDAANRTLTLAGHIVLAPGVFAHSDGVPITEAEKTALDALHFAKIDLADEVFVVNPGGYIGSSTANEIAYATKRGTPVRYLVEEF